MPPLGDVLEFLRLIWAVDHALQKASKRMATTLSVTGPQRLVLRIVARLPGVSAGALATVLHVHPSTLTGILKRLEKRGLVARKPDPSDARRALLTLSARGKQFDADTPGTVEAAVRNTLRRVSPAELRHTTAVLAALAQALNSDVPAGTGSKR